VIPQFSQYRPSQFGEVFTLRYYYDMPIPADFYPGISWLLRAILYRRYLNMNTFLLIVGGVRTGKSFTGLKIMEMISKLLNIPFGVTKQVSFELRPFLEWSRTATYSFYMLDEIGVSLSTSDWWTLQSKIMRNFAQTQGFRGNTLIMTVPNIAFFQKHFRFMCNYGIETVRQGQVSVYKIVVRHLLGKGSPRYVGSMNVELPSEDLIKTYTDMKVSWNNDKLQEDLDWLNNQETPVLEERKFSYGDYIEFFKNDVITDDMLREKLGKFNFRPEDIENLIKNEGVKKLTPEDRERLKQLEISS
jgi:hypothetical protein